MKRTKNIGLVFEHFAASSHPLFHLDRPFDVAPTAGRRYTPADLATLVARLSASLHQAGLRKGDKMAIVKDNHFDTVLLAAAAARLGAVGAMISNTIRPEHLATMMGRLQPRVLVAGPSTLTAAAEAGVSLVGPDCTIIAAGEGAEHAGVLTFPNLDDPAIPAASPCGDDEPMICTHTSGTTGVPKLVVHSPNTLLGVLAKLETLPLPRLSIHKDDVVGSCISFVHGRAITWAAAQLARPPAEVVILSGSEPDSVVSVLGEHPPTTLEACPNIFQRWEGLTRSHPKLFSRIRTYFNTFDAVHPRTVRTFLNASEHRSPLWVQVWGQSEVGPVSPGIYTRRQMQKAEGRDHSITSNVGRPFPFLVRVKAVDPETRADLPRGREGIVMVKTKGRCLTYLGEDDRHQEKIWDGWWNTGDIGVVSRTGGVRILDREVDIIPGMSGIELESLLLERLPTSTEVIVLGAPGRKPVPVISTQDGTLDPEVWRQAGEGLPKLEEPIIVDWDDFPRTATWKVRRFELREQLLGSSQTFGSGLWT
ncbi:MAG: class I adenylate-forming enzyme family protein [Streptosporangiaceae bacterium]